MKHESWWVIRWLRLAHLKNLRYENSFHIWNTKMDNIFLRTETYFPWKNPRTITRQEKYPGNCIPCNFVPHHEISLILLKRIWQHQQWWVHSLLYIRRNAEVELFNFDRNSFSCQDQPHIPTEEVQTAEHLTHGSKFYWSAHILMQPFNYQCFDFNWVFLTIKEY